MLFQMQVPGFQISVSLDPSDKNDRSLLAKCFLKANRELKREIKGDDDD